MGRNRQAQRTHQDQRQTRAERRLTERESAKAHAASVRRRPGGISRGTVAGIVATVMVLVAISAIALSRAGGTGGAQQQRLTNPDALSPKASLLAAGTQAPDFSLYDINGRRHTLSVQRGHPILLEFFADWCPNCHAEAPVITKLERAYMPKGVRVWSVLANPYGPNYDSSNRTDLTLASKADQTTYQSQYHVLGEELIDPNFTMVNQWGANAYPTIYIVDTAGKISYVQQGKVPYGLLAKAVDKALTAQSGGSM